MSGVEIAKAQGEFVRKIELTSSPSSPSDVHRSFRTFVKRVRRAFQRFEYIATKEFTKGGLVHLHVLYRGRFIPQRRLSELWEEVHGAKIVFIRLVKASRVRETKKSCAYVVKYCEKVAERYWMSYRWVFWGFVKKWNGLVHLYGFRALGVWKSLIWAFARGLDVILPQVWDRSAGLQVVFGVKI